MNKTRFITKVGLTLIGLTLIGVLPFCGGTQRNLIHDYLITEISIKNHVLELSQDSLHVVYRKAGEILDSNENYGLEIIFIDSVTAIRELTANTFGIVDNVNATEASFILYNLLNRIDSINIKTLFDIDSKSSTGTDVTKLFYTYNSRRLPSPTPIGKFDTSALNNNSYYLRSLDFVLYNKPKADSMMQFEINFYFSDSTITILKTEEIIIR